MHKKSNVTFIPYSGKFSWGHDFAKLKCPPYKFPCNCVLIFKTAKKNINVWVSAITLQLFTIPQLKVQCRSADIAGVILTSGYSLTPSVYSSIICHLPASSFMCSIMANFNPEAASIIMSYRELKRLISTRECHSCMPWLEMWNRIAAFEVSKSLINLL